MLTISILVFSQASWAQSITISDASSRQGIYNVSVIPDGTGKVIFSSEDGVVDISEYTAVESFLFRHPSYQRLILTYDQIKEKNFMILLEERVISIDEVVISANKWEQDKSEVANEILSISPQQIKHNNPQTAADLLSQTGQVFVQKSQLGGGSPMLRGFAANRVLIVVDGVRMNNAIFRSGNLQNVISIDPNIIENAEVVFGPGSVIYGSDALGGVMDFHTKVPVFTSKQRSELSAKAFTRYASANNEKTGHFDFNLSRKGVSLLTSFTHSDFGDLRSGSNRSSDYPQFGLRPRYVKRINGQDILVTNPDQNVQKFSGYKQWSIVNKIRFQINDEHEATYGFYYANTSDIPRYDRLIQDNGHPDSLRNAEWYYGPQKWYMHHLSIASFSGNAVYDEAKLTFSIQNFSESRNDRRFGNNSLRVQQENVDVFTMNMDFDKGIKSHNLFYGIEYTYNHVDSRAFRRDIVTQAITSVGSRYPDEGSDYEALAGYMTYKMRFSDRWILNMGMRYSQVWLQAETTDSNATLFGLNALKLGNGALNGNAGIVFKANETTKWNFLISSGFRSPNVDDVGKVFELDNDNLIIPNADLRPEFSYNVEMGLEKRIKKNVRLGVVTYYSLLKDAIVRGPVSLNGSNTIVLDGELKELRAQVNADEAYVYGGSANLAWNINPNWSFNTSYTITRGRDKSNDQPLRHTTPNFGKTSIVFNRQNIRAEFFTEYNGSRLREDIPTSEIDDKDYLYATHESDLSKDGSPAWYTLNLRGTYNLNDKITFTGALENILDTHYRPYSSGISAPGRNLILSLRVTF